MEVFVDSISDWVPHNDVRNTLASAITSYSAADGSFIVDPSGMSAAELLDISPSTSWNVRQTYSSTDSLN